MNCPNCGAPLNSKKCEYCGTDYTFSVDMINNTFGILNINGEQIRVYVSEIKETVLIDEFSFYDLHGNHFYYPPKIKREFTLIEC